MKTVVEYNRKIKQRHFVSSADRKNNNNHFNSRVHEDGRANTLHYKQIQYEFCSKEDIF